MINLRTISDKYLTKTAIQVLEKNAISTVLDFLETDSYILKIHTEIPIPTIEKCKFRIQQQYKPKSCTLLAQKRLLGKDGKSKSYGTGVKCLDELLLADPFGAGRVWEVCGESGVGKSFFCHTVMLNYTAKHKNVCLYIDTKRDFSGQLLRSMQRAQHLNTRVCGQIMQRIRVTRAYTATALVNVLQTLLGELEKPSSSISLPKMVIIDSLPAIFMAYSSRISRLHGNWMLTQVSSLIQELSSKYNIAFLLTNLSISEEATWFNSDDVDDIASDEEAENCSNARSSDKELSAEARIQLGVYWSSILRVRFTIDIPTAEEIPSADMKMRKIRILKSCYTATNVHCFVRLTTAGIISAPNSIAKASTII